MDRNRYAEIMAQMSQVKPLTISGYPSTYTGGYDVAQPQAYAAPVNRYAETIAPMMGGSRMTTAEDTGGWVAPTSQTAYNISTLGRNLKYVSPITGALTGAYGNYLASKVNENYSNEGRNSGGGGHDWGGGGQTAATGGNNGDASGGGDRGTRGGFAQGGHVSIMDLQGPDPQGPDDGYAALKDGEFVINDKAVKKYGIELMQAINSGKISKGKLRGLLEM
ncbi:hypothetical protein UFOVP189_51 [uncultured Caudovirales phage]|uniref:Uncharacterized protein n=1 Tax=uncultured Caudovirales phage TaxID=2100421 RepID=A0A6J7WGH7_9CAUD|nr:hypothetical protein UFOVP189_51 [uncultured Caudovirales phage]